MQRLEKALDLLEVFLRQEGEIGISELARLSGLNVSTAYRIASTLVKRGYLSQSQSRGKYSIGLKLVEFGSAVKRAIRVREVALPVLERLNEIAEESVNLAVLDANEAVYIEHIESHYDLRMFTEVGNRVPLYCTGVGKVLLAYRGEEEMERYLNGRHLTPYTRNTITDIGKLRRELATIRREGVAIDNEEKELGVKCVAAPVRDQDGNVVAAVSISGPSARLTSGKVRKLKSLVRDFGREISRKMGYQGD